MGESYLELAALDTGRLGSVRRAEAVGKEALRQVADARTVRVVRHAARVLVAGEQRLMVSFAWIYINLKVSPAI